MRRQLIVPSILEPPAWHVSPEMCRNARSAIDRTIDLFKRKLSAVSFAELGQIDGDVAAKCPQLRTISLAIDSMAPNAVGLVILLAGGISPSCSNQG